MGHQKATLAMDNIAVTLSIYEESADEFDYERIIAQVELETPSGNEYKERKEVEQSPDSVLTAIHSFFKEAENSRDILEDALEDVIQKAETDLDTRMHLNTRELIYEFEQNTQQAV